MSERTSCDCDADVEWNEGVPYYVPRPCPLHADPDTED